MRKDCPTCHGTGTLTSDCSYCRNADEFEFDQLRPGTCTACQGEGYLEETCPVCGGFGYKELVAPTLAKAGSF